MRVPGLMAAILAAVLFAVGCGDESTASGGASGGTGGSAGSGPTSMYANLANWLCHPDVTGDDNVCNRNLDATIVNADGTTSIEPHIRAENPEFDCFYVYPTASGDPTGNSDLIAGEEEIFTARNQAARYTRHCRVFAPLYRQVTVPTLLNPMLESDFELAYGDVRDAFQHYLDNESDGRGFLLVGHSQGSGHLSRLIAEEIETDTALAARLIAAHLIGITISVPNDADVGGTFASTPLCASADQTGCVINYASFRADVPPDPENSLFARTNSEDTKAACVNPAVLNMSLNGSQPYFPVTIDAGLLAFVFSDPPGPVR